MIIQTGEPLEIDGGSPRPMRAMNLSAALVRNGHRVTIVSSRFYHQEKRHRDVDTIVRDGATKTILLNSPGYTSHIGIARLWDHLVLGFKLNKFLENLTEVPDLLFVGYPPVEVGFFAVRWAKKNSVPTILDVKDLWPDLFVEKVPTPLKSLARFCLFPYYLSLIHI